MKHSHPDVEPIPLVDAIAPADPVRSSEVNAAEVVRVLSPLVTPARLQRIQTVVRGRLSSLRVVLDSIADPHNASAVLRSCDALGVQHVHVIPSCHGFSAAKTVAKGTHHWLDMVRHESPESCLSHLKGSGYRVYVATMEGTETLDTIPTEHPVAVVFGNERRGPDPHFRDQADGTFAIPMKGFVESLNVSVAAAITLHHLSQRMPGTLHPPQQTQLLAQFLRRTVGNSDQVLRREGILTGHEP